MGNTWRHVPMKVKRVINNQSFKEYLSNRNLEVPTSYGMIARNMTAGFKSFMKYDKPQPTYDNKAWRKACDWTRHHFGVYVNGCSVLSQEEVITELDKSTSCGFPWSLRYHNKTEFLASPAAEVISWYWDNMSSHYHPIWTCTQKTEMRAREKIENNKIRTFTAAPIEHTVALGRLCMHYNNKFYDADQTWSFVGRSKFNQGWNLLYSRLLKHGEGLEFDAKDWDASCFQAALWDQMEMRWECLNQDEQTPANRKRLEYLYGEIIHSVVVMENGELVRKHTGNPSGSGNTIVDNTQILFRVLAYAWIRTAPEDANTYPYFMSQVEAALNGDDNDVCIAEQSRVFYNASTIIPAVAELGVRFVTPTPAFRPANELEFLSMHCVKRFGLWLPAPETDKVLCSLYCASDLDDIRWHLLRASALYIDSWANEELESILSGYIQWVCSRHTKFLTGEVNGHPFSVVQNNIKSSSWCKVLYCGYENMGCKGNESLPIKFIVPMGLESDIASAIITHPRAGSRAIVDALLFPYKQPEAAYDLALKGLGVPRNASVHVNKMDMPAHSTILNAINGRVGNKQIAFPHQKDQRKAIRAIPHSSVSRTTPQYHVDVVPAGEQHAGNKRNRNGDPIKKLQAKAKQVNRPRTGNPVADGLVGVEPNPGPAKKMKAKRKVSGKPTIRNGIGGKNASKINNALNSRKVSLSYGPAIQRVSVPAAMGAVGTGNAFRGHGTRMILGSSAHVFSGRCAVQNLASTAGGGFVFQDGGTGTSQFMYLNPRICCQNSNYATPAGLCPIGVIAQAFRKYSFRSLTLCYEPTAVNTSQTGVVSVAYDPEVLVTLASGLNTPMGYANFECSKYGPMWKAFRLNITPFLDRSKWFYGETPGTIGTSLIASQSIQGTVTLLQATAPSPSTLFGMFWLEFELALSELGPTEVFTVPALSAPEKHVDSKDECKEPQPEVPESKEPESPELVEHLDHSVHIPRSMLSKLLMK